MRKTILFIFSLALLSAAFVGTRTLAATNAEEALGELNAAAGTGGADIAGSGPMDPRIIAAIIIRSALALIGTVFIVLIVYAGFLYMTAGGEEGNIEKAKKLLYNSVVGLIIILSAYSIAYFVFSVVLGTGGSYSNPFGYGSNSNITNYGANPGNYNYYTGP